MDYQGNRTASGDILRLCTALKNNILRNLHVADVCQVSSIDNNSYYCKALCDEAMINAIPLEGLELHVNDVVLVMYTDNDFRVNLNRIKNYDPLVNNQQSTEVLHNRNCGVIVGKLYSR